MFDLSSINGLNLCRSLLVLRGIFLAFILVSSYNGFAAASEAEHHTAPAATQVLQAPGSTTPEHNEQFCLLCHIGCHCQAALLGDETVQPLNRPVLRFVFETSDSFLSSADPSQTIKPPRMG